MNFLFESRVFLVKKEDWFTIPNILSYIRIFMIPLYVYLYLNASSLRDYYIAATVLVLSGITDALDGIIARKTGQITDLGKLLDPLADKLTQVAMIAAMFIERPYILPLLLLFILKELYLLVNNMILVKKGILLDGAMWFGKVATATFYLCMFLLVIFPYFDQYRSMILIKVTAGFQIISLIGYSQWFYSKYKKEHLGKSNGMDG